MFVPESKLAVNAQKCEKGIFPHENNIWSQEHMEYSFSKNFRVFSPNPIVHFKRIFKDSLCQCQERCRLHPVDLSKAKKETKQVKFLHHWRQMLCLYLKGILQDFLVFFRSNVWTVPLEKYSRIPSFNHLLSSFGKISPRQQQEMVLALLQQLHLPSPSHYSKNLGVLFYPQH
jgi:hypothetical protein